MPQKITKSVKSMVEAAKREIEEIEAADATKLHGRQDVVLVDIRDPRERWRDGTIPGAKSVTRGMLEFWADPESEYYKPYFEFDRRIVVYCAGGLRSALAADTLKTLGFTDVGHIEGGFGACRPTTRPSS